MKKPVILSIINLFLLIPCFSQGQTLIKRVVASHLDTPWEILWGPDSMIWMTERKGLVSRLDPVSGKKTVLLKLNDIVELTESGLMGMALDPAFQSNHYVYLAYTYRFSGNITVRVSRFTFSNDSLISEKILLDDIRGNTNHDGTRLSFGPDGKLYISTGDAEDTSLPQDTTKPNGKILRMNTDGSVPSDNPISGSYVWAYGLRNTQGLVWVKGKLYGSEHGVDADDELNWLRAGRNFGWPEVNGYCDQPAEITFCNAHNVAEPLHVWTPSIAPCGMDYYNEGPITAWQHSLLLTSLKGSRLIQLKLNPAGDSITGVTDSVIYGYGRLRDLCISPEGKVYIATSNQDGRGTGIDSTDDRIIEISAEKSSGIAPQAEMHFSIYPNPASAQIHIGGLPQQAFLEVYTILGQKLASLPVSATADIDCSGWPRGCYLLSLKTAQGVQVEKIMVSH